MRVPSKALFLLCMAGLALSGCQQDSPVGGKFRKPVKSVVSLSPSTTEFSILLGVPLVGRTAADDYPPTVLSIPVVATVKPDFERIAELKPSVVMYDADLYSPSDVEKIKALGPDIITVVLDGYTVDDFLKAVFRLGQATGSETNMSDYVSRVQTAEGIVRGDTINPQPTVAVVMPAPNANPYVAGTGSFTADLVRVSGGKPVGPDSHKFEPMSMEALVAINPDIIIIPTAPKSKDDPLAQNPQLSALKAVKNHKVLEIDQDYMLRRGSRVDTVLKELHAVLVKVSKS